MSRRLESGFLCAVHEGREAKDTKAAGDDPDQGDKNGLTVDLVTAHPKSKPLTVMGPGGASPKRSRGAGPGPRNRAHAPDGSGDPTGFDAPMSASIAMRNSLLRL